MTDEATLFVGGAIWNMGARLGGTVLTKLSPCSSTPMSKRLVTVRHRTPEHSNACLPITSIQLRKSSCDLAQDRREKSLRILRRPMLDLGGTDAAWISCSKTKSRPSPFLFPFHPVPTPEWLSFDNVGLQRPDSGLVVVSSLF
jgi:hypothetical protein